MHDEEHNSDQPESTPPANQQASGISRRNFLKAAGAGAVALGTSTPLLAGNTNTTNANVAAAALAQTDATSSALNPASLVETWDEPWVWRPSEFPGQQLQMNVVEHQSASVVVGFGNPGAAIFTYNGFTPGPTIRMKGDETLRVKLLNHLGLNGGSSPVGPAPDPAAFPPGQNQYPEGVTFLPDWCLGEHTNGVHSARTTNLHTHGLHVRPGVNPDGTHSDNIFVRIMPFADYTARQEDENCRFLRELEQVGQGDYEFRLGDVMGNPDAPHPPGTHWYHPHPHGSTHNEVSSGMAGFLIVEGDVDEAINMALTGQAAPDPAMPTGTYDYRERLMLIQRINPGLVSRDPDAMAKRLQSPTIPVSNGTPEAAIITMRPGAIERWRVLNGSVDGKGYLRFMVLKGQWVHEAPPNPPEGTNPKAQLLRVEVDGTRVIPTTEEIEAAKQHLYQLAFDGVTLVRETDDNGAEYYIKDLNFDAPPNPLLQDFTNLSVCYTDAETLNACYNRPNEVYMAPANRIDVMFKAPELADVTQAELYTVLGKATAIHTENLEREFQVAQADLDVGLSNSFQYPGLPPDTVVAYIAVDNDDNENFIPDFDILSLNQDLPPVPPYLMPIQDDELQIGAEEAEQRDMSPGLFRTRRSTYSGWGAATWPRITPDQLTQFDPNGPEPGEINPLYLFDGPGIGEMVVPPDLRTMAIDGLKFNPTDPGPKPAVDTAEEWVVYNNSLSLYGEFQYGEIDGNAGWRRDHSVGYPVTRNEATDQGWNIVTRGIDHPFHIHTNPFWLLRVDVPDADGNLVNVLPEPRWSDVIWLPRNGGRVIFRSRYPDFIGVLVNHCHILLHEDNGMMQSVEIVPDVEDVNYHAQSEVFSPDMTPEEVNRIYPPNTPEEIYIQCTHFVDNNMNPFRAQQYPSENGAFRPPDDA